MIFILLVLIILLLFAYVTIIFTAFEPMLLLNVIMIIALFIFIKKDLAQEDMKKYYAVSLFISALILIFSQSSFLRLFFYVIKERLFLSYITITLLLIHVIANIIMYAKDIFSEERKSKRIVNNIKKKVKEIKKFKKKKK